MFGGSFGGSTYTPFNTTTSGSQVNYANAYTLTSASAINTIK